MNKEFVPYEQSLELKRLGFNEPCFGAHAVWGFMSSNDVNSLSDNVTQEDLDNQAYLEEDGVCLAPLYQQAFGWFREKHRIYLVIGVAYDRGRTFYIRIETGPSWGYQYFDVEFPTYEEAQLAALKKMIEIVKNK